MFMHATETKMASIGEHRRENVHAAVKQKRRDRAFDLWVLMRVGTHIRASLQRCRTGQ